MNNLIRCVCPAGYYYKPGVFTEAVSTRLDCTQTQYRTVYVCTVSAVRLIPGTSLSSKLDCSKPN
jgi:hypothetical protein